MPIVRIELGILTLVNPVKAKACLPIVKTESGIINGLFAHSDTRILTVIVSTPSTIVPLLTKESSAVNTVPAI